MQILLIHLSDIHFKDQDNTISGKIDPLSEAVKSLLPRADACFILVSGDIAFSGLPSEYMKSLDFFISLKESLSSLYPNILIEFILTPGNHDCNFNRHNEARSLIINNLTDLNLGDFSIIEHCTDVQYDFRAFLENINEQKPKSDNQLFYSYQYNLDKYSVRFNCFNTAWVSKIKEVQGSILYPIDIVNIPSNNVDLVISLFHHTYNWFQHENARAFTKVIEKSSDLILTGHEHDQDSFKKENGTGTITHYLEGGILQDADNSKNSNFNTILLDLDSHKYKIFLYSWDRENGLYRNFFKSDDWKTFSRKSNLMVHGFQVRDYYEKQLLDPEVQYTHPNKNTLDLSDLYVFPFLKEYNPKGKVDNIKSSIVEGRHIIDNIFINNKTLIIGEERSGKTSLAKTLFREMLSKGLVPILINGEDIKSKDFEKLENLIQRKFLEQYDDTITDKYNQLDKSKKLIIIDNFHHIKLNKKGRDEALRILFKLSDRLIIFGSDLLRLEFIEYMDTSSIWLEFKLFELLQFGHLLREQVIRKWYLIGKEYEIDEYQLLIKINYARNIINTIIGEGLVPSYPFFILFMMQQIDANIPITSGISSHGYCYECFITNCLKRTVTDFEELTTKYNYLSELAYFMFTSKISRLSYAELIEFHDYYCKDYRIHLDLASFLRHFKLALILTEVNNHYSFKYKYSYYYFVARYLKDNIDNGDIKDILSNIIDKLYKEENAQIIIFLSYLTKHNFIIDKILASATTIFPDIKPCDLDKDVEFINNLQSKPFEVFLEQNDPDKEREQYLRRMDEFDATKENNIEPENKEVLDEMNEFIQYNLAFKTILVLGQIIKNYSGALKGNIKLNIARECYMLGLRSLNKIYLAFNENSGIVINDMMKVFKEKYNIQEDKAEKRAKDYLFVILEIMTYGFIKTLSHSGGSEKLEETYNDLLSDRNMLSVEMVNICIKLDHFSYFPERDVFQIIKKIGKNHFSLTLLKLLVVQYFYLMPCDVSIKQRVCESLGIKIKGGRPLSHYIKKVGS